jgi:hypothetical protein
MSATSPSAWKLALNSTWSKENAAAFLDSIGIDFTTAFLDPLNRSKLEHNPYQNHIWQVMANSQIPQGVLHVYPIEIADAPIIWEEWFLLNGEIRHHILSNAPLDNEDGIWQPQPTDTDHPKIVLNTKWHYRNSKDLSPSLI